MEDFRQIYLSWRPGSGSPREIVGLIEREGANQYTFRYLERAQKLVMKQMFIPYFEFPDIKKVYQEGVMDTFALRLMKADRTDISRLYDFWNVDSEKASDKFYVLGKTQGLATTDNFEFLADYIVHDKLSFVTEIAGISKNEPLKAGILNLNDELRYELEPDNEFDQAAVKIYKKDLFLGYVKKIHSKVFYKPGGDKLSVGVKGWEQNGAIKKIFIDVRYKS